MTSTTPLTEREESRTDRMDKWKVHRIKKTRVCDTEGSERMELETGSSIDLIGSGVDKLRVHYTKDHVFEIEFDSKKLSVVLKAPTVPIKEREQKSHYYDGDFYCYRSDCDRVCPGFTKQCPIRLYHPMIEKVLWRDKQ